MLAENLGKGMCFKKTMSMYHIDNITYKNITITRYLFIAKDVMTFTISKKSWNSDFSNIKQISKKRFLEKEVGKKIGSYDKSDFETSFITSESVTLAVKQEEKFENELEKIIDNLGSNVGNLIKEILDIHI